MTMPRASTTGSTTVLADTPEYAQFYLGSMYAWKENGVARVLTFLQNWNVDCAHYHFDDEVGWFHVRCLRSDAKYIQAKFVNLQHDIEREVGILKTSKTAEAPFEILDHPDVEMPTYLPHALDMSSIEAASDALSSADFGNGPKISLMVPESLREFPLVGAWQDLQPRDKSFDEDFMSKAAKEKIERAHNVALVADEGQKVIFIGGSDIEVLGLVKAKLTTLLQDFLSLDQEIPYLRHVFFVSQPVHGNWEVNIRKIMNVNPGIRKSTILDPWYFGGNYHHLAAACCLRACLEDPLRKGPRHALWSVVGPFPKSLLETQSRQITSEVFKNLKVAPRRRVSPQIETDENGVANWLKGISEPKCTVPDLGVIDSKEDFNPMRGLGEDDPIPLDFGHVGVGRAGNVDNDEPVPLNYERYVGKNPQITSTSQAPHPGTRYKNPNILDRDDPVLRDPKSALQRPMLPPKRTIRVAHPDTLSRNNVQSATSQELDINRGRELDRLVTSVQNLLRPMSVRYGLVELRVEMGRFFATNVPTSGLSTNFPNTPAHGWKADDLREKMKLQQSLFTQALCYFGSDVDILVKMKIKGTNTAMWKVNSRDVFLDFRFKAIQSHSGVGGVEYFWDLVLEVNTKDYSWRIRAWENECGSTFVHCLRQHWDFRVRLSHDRSLEWEEYFGKFATALIDSLEVSPPKLEFQNFFDTHPVVINKDMPIQVTDARIRQVCRLQHHDKKTYLDVTRMLPTKPTKSGPCNSNYTEMATLNPNRTNTGEFSQWYEAALSSVRFEEALRENTTLVPGDKANWNVEDLTQEVRHLCEQAAGLVEQIDPVGVDCDNGFDEKYWNSIPKDPGNYTF